MECTLALDFMILAGYQYSRDWGSSDWTLQSNLLCKMCLASFFSKIGKHNSYHLNSKGPSFKSFSNHTEANIAQVWTDMYMIWLLLSKSRQFQRKEVDESIQDCIYEILPRSWLPKKVWCSSVKFLMLEILHAFKFLNLRVHASSPRIQQDKTFPVPIKACNVKNEP